MTTKQFNNRVNGAAAFERVMHGAARIERVVQKTGQPEIEMTMSDGTVLILVVKDLICPTREKTAAGRERR